MKADRVQNSWLRSLVCMTAISFLMLFIFLQESAFPQATGSISGVVKNSAQTPIGGVEINIYDNSGKFLKISTSDTEGLYTVNGLATGNYYVCTNAQSYINKCYQNAKPDYGSCVPAPVRVVAPNSTPNINFSLDLGGSISGSITPLSDGENVQVYAENCITVLGISNAVSTSGDYIIGGLPQGSYRVCVNAYGTDYSSKCQESCVNVTAGGSVTNQNISLTSGGTGTISGLVICENDCNPGPISVAAVDADINSGSPQLVILDYVCENDTYQLQGIPYDTQMWLYAVGDNKQTADCTSDYFGSFADNPVEVSATNPNALGKNIFLVESGCCTVNADCNDGLYCNGVETCALGICQPGTYPCPGADGDSNCKESCNEATDTCTAADPNGSTCDDGVFCNGEDTCNAGTCATHAGNPCVPDVDDDCSEKCDETTDSCTLQDPNGSACDDGVFCNGADTCTAGTCSTHAGKPCPGQSVCDEISDKCICTSSAACNDNLFCNGTETCVGGYCQLGTNPCPGPDGDSNCKESCNEAADNCTADDLNGSACNDSLFCNGNDTCTAGACATHTGNPCPGQSCNETSDQCVTDTVKPAITINSPTTEVTYSTPYSSINIGGTASDDVNVTQVTWVNNRGGSGTATGTTTWLVSNIALQEGDNIITVTARDVADKTGTDQITVKYSIPPTCALNVLPFTTAKVNPGDAITLTAYESGFCDASPQYQWSFKSQGLVDSTLVPDADSCIYTAGDNNTGENRTDIIQVKDAANNLIVEMSITVSGDSIKIFPEIFPRSHLIPLPLIMLITGDGTDFDKEETEVSFDSAIMSEPLSLVLSPRAILVFSLISPAGFGEQDSMTVRVRAITPSTNEEVSTDIILWMLPGILKE